MATPSINGTSLNSGGGQRARGYTFHPGERRTAGDGSLTVVGAQRVVWEWTSLSSSEWTFWTSTLMSGADSLTVTAAELWDEDWAEQTFTSGVLYKPVAEIKRGGRYWNVTVEIRNLLPLV